jgi:hypothetical protein
MRAFRGFDGRFTALRYGYTDAEDYYRRARAAATWGRPMNRRTLPSWNCTR